MSTSPASIPLSLTPEMRQAIAASGGAPIQLADPETRKVYLLTEQDEASHPFDEYVQQKLDEGMADIEAGRTAPWDPDRIKREGRERLAARGTQPSKG